MKTLLSLIALVSISFSAVAQSKSPDKKIKYIIQHEFDPTQNITSADSKDWVFGSESFYNKEGNVVWEYGRYKSKGDTTYYTYDDKGRMLKMYNKRIVFRNYTYNTDSKGRLVITNHLEKYTAIIHIIDEKTGIDTSYVYANNGEFMFKRVYNYNANHTVRTITELRPYGTETEQTVETYDFKKRKTDEVIIKNGKRESHETIKYDNDSYTRIDSNKMYIGGPPAKIIGDKITSFTYKYEQLDTSGNPKVTKLLYNGRYVIASVRKIEYY